MEPLISCLCVTKNRPEKLSQAIECFKSQTYSNLELVVVYENNDVATANLLELQRDICLKMVVVDSDKNQSLGELRNISIESAKGEFFCQWDDDDWYHPNRIQYQLDEILNSNKMACLLSRWYMLDATTGDYYLSHKRLWEGSILCNLREFRRRKIHYPAITKSEDTSVIEILDSLDEVCLLEIPHLYIYTFHGTNTWEMEHFKMNWNKGTPVSIHDLRELYSLS